MRRGHHPVTTIGTALNKIGERGATHPLFGAARIGHHLHGIATTGGELSIDIEHADGIDLVAEKVYAVGVYIAVREDIDYTAAHRILTGSPHEIVTHEAHRHQTFGELIHRYLVAPRYLQCSRPQLALLCNLLG